jgi:opacity protein-like surface antigen
MMNRPLHRSSFLRFLMVAWALLALASAAHAASFVGEVTLNIGASQLERAGKSGQSPRDTASFPEMSSAPPPAGMCTFALSTARG